MLKGKFTAPTGHTDNSAFLTISGMRIDFTNEVAVAQISIYKSETAYKEGKSAITTASMNINKETEEGSLIPAFSELLGVDKLSDESYNPVMALYGLIKTIPMFKGFEEA